MRIVFPANRRKTVERFRKRFGYAKPSLVESFRIMADYLNFQSVNEKVAVVLDILFVEKEKSMLVSVGVVEEGEVTRSCLAIVGEDGGKILSFAEGERIRKIGSVHGNRSNLVLEITKLLFGATSLV